MYTPDKSKFITLLLFLIPFWSTLLSIDLNFKYYMVEDGLSSNTVYDILQDSKGFVWIGTENGLNRFDGYRFVSFTHIPRDSSTIINNYVYTLFEDNRERLWIGTEQGIGLYGLNSGYFCAFDAKTSDGVGVTDRIQKILVDRDGNIWIGAGAQGIFVYDGQGLLTQHNFESEKLNRSEPVWVSCVYKDKRGVIWASVSNTKSQIYIYDKKISKFVAAFPDLGRDMLTKFASHAIIEDTFGTIWLGTWLNGLYAIDRKTGKISDHCLYNGNKAQIQHIHSITEIEPGKFLIGSNDGLTLFSVSPVIGNRLEVHITEPVITNRFVYPVYQDKEGGLWIGTYYGGINYASPNRNYFLSYIHDKYQNSLNGNVVSCFCEDMQGHIWIGTDDGGLNCFDPKSERFTHYKPETGQNSLSYHNIHALCIDDDNLWIGTYTGGLNVMDLKTKHFRHYFFEPDNPNSLGADNVYSLFKDSRGNIWVGTTAGANLYDREKDNFVSIFDNPQMTGDITQLGNTILFATNGNGIYAYDLDTKQLENYKFEYNNTRSLPSNDISCFCVDEQGILWIGSNNGICIFNPEDETFESVDADLPSNAIFNIFCDNGYLWITTSKGLVRYNPRSKHIRIFTKGDGLLSEQFIQKSGYKAKNGRIYMGTAQGFNAFYPKQISENRHVPQVHFTDFQLFNRSVDIHNYLEMNENDTMVKLAHNENSFSFEYTALSYYAPEKNEYAYFLEGFDRDWNYMGTIHKAVYTNIPPGEYVFRVKASNNDGIWNDKGYSIRIMVSPPIWWNTWSITIYSILMICALIGIIIYMRRLDEKKHQEKIEKIKNEQEKEVYNSKIAFFTNVAHEIRTPVSLIIGPLEEITKNTHDLPDKVVRNINIINKNSKRLLTLVNQLLDFRKIEKQTIQVLLANANVYEFLQNIYERFSSFIENKNIEFNFTYDTCDFVTGIDEENLTKVVSNMLNNASKYTTDYIELHLDSRKGEDVFEITVIDNGPGIPEKEKENVFKPFYQVAENHKSGTGIGLYLVKLIVDAFYGEITLKDHENGGLVMTILLPKMDVKTSKVPDVADITDSLVTPSSQSLKADVEDDVHDSCTLLIVEDNLDLQSFLADTYAGMYTVLHANNGIEGIRILENNEVDIIISDIMMPEMDGIEFSRKIKGNPLWNHIPVILLTAKINMSSKIEALEIGADAYVEKPFSVEYLTAQIRNLLESRRQLLKKFTETPYASLKSIAGNDADQEFLSKVNEIIDKNLSNELFNVKSLAEELNMSSSGLYARIKKLTATTPNNLLLLIRLKKAEELLIENRYRINEICYMVGFSNPSYFAKCFQKQYGILPKEYREAYHN